MLAKEILLKKFGQKKLRTPKKLVTKKLDKIGSVIAELFLIWTKVAKTNVAWTNITLIASVKDGPRNLPLKLGQNWFSKS